MCTIVTVLVEYALEEAFSATLRKLLEKRIAAGREILLDELSRAEKNLGDLAEQEPVVAIFYEFFEAVKRGTAKRNLRLLAQIATNEISAPKVYSDGFLWWSSILASLTQEEIIVAAKLHELNSGSRLLEQTDLTQDKLVAELVGVGKLFAAKEALEATEYGLFRTGLVYPMAGYVGYVFLTSPMMDKLMSIARMEDVLAERD